MKNLIIIFIAILFSTTLLSQSIEEEKESIKNVVQRSYVEGLQNEGDPAKIDDGFHPDFQLIGIGEKDEMWQLKIKDWKAKQVQRKKEGKLPRPKDQEVNIKILDVDVTGTAAVVKLEFFVGVDKKYVDYISLYKFESGWKMVNKIYYQIPQE